MVIRMKERRRKRRMRLLRLFFGVLGSVLGVGAMAMVRHSMAGEVMTVLTFRVLGQSRTERSKSMALVLVRLVLPTVGT